MLSPPTRKLPLANVEPVNPEIPPPDRHVPLTAKQPPLVRLIPPVVEYVVVASEKLMPTASPPTDNSEPGVVEPSPRYPLTPSVNRFVPVDEAMVKSGYVGKLASPATVKVEASDVPFMVLVPMPVWPVLVTCKYDVVPEVDAMSNKSVDWSTAMTLRSEVVGTVDEPTVSWLPMVSNVKAGKPLPFCRDSALVEPMLENQPPSEVMPESKSPPDE